LTELIDIGCVQLNIKKTIAGAMNLFQEEIFRYSPCLFQLSNGKICGIGKEWHTTGHHGIKTGKHEGPPLPLGLISTVVGHIKELLKLVRMLYCVLLYMCVYVCKMLICVSFLVFFILDSGETSRKEFIVITKRSTAKTS
jgi:hypothetical protein